MLKVVCSIIMLIDRNSAYDFDQYLQKGGELKMTSVACVVKFGAENLPVYSPPNVKVE